LYIDRLSKPTGRSVFNIYHDSRNVQKIVEYGSMQGYFAFMTPVLLAATVAGRVLLLKRAGTRAMIFGKTDRSDFLVIPFALFYFYTVVAAAFGLPLAGSRRLFTSGVVSWAGVGLCAAGLALHVASLISFGASFRVGIDTGRPGKLVTTGVFAISRNPIYAGFALVLLGQFLVFPSWIPLAYLAAGVLLFHRQVLREEHALRTLYGKQYEEYCRRVRRYL
jgi:protein-S-isoprenylcysteine O-methyltransferase Ste14